VAIPPGGDALVRIAGHPPPMVIRPGITTIDPPVGLPLGIATDAVWEPARLPLAPGWALLVHTDGLIEGNGPVAGEPLWPEGLLTLIDDERGTDLEVLPARLVERVQALHGGPLPDDVAILLLSGAQG
jgi:serine phosphatase RsbU (regulator of sigma subunit)